MQVITLFGSNLGNKYQIINQAVQLLASSAGSVSTASSFYETEPWGFECEENFLNRVVVFETNLTPQTFLYHCLETEKQLGRQRHPSDLRYSSRTIDIDILFYESLIMDTPDLILPHPRICERNFVLTPLSEILPDFIHPVFQKTISELLAQCQDKLAAIKMNDER